MHGGSFYTGASSTYGLDGSNLANAQNMIVVVVQYRLGLLEFMKLDSLGIDGNFGLKDVRYFPLVLACSSSVLD